MKMIWSATEPEVIEDHIGYILYNNTNKVEIRCRSYREIEVVRAAIHATLERMNKLK